MRRLLLSLLIALILGSVGIWLIQHDQGYILISLAGTVVEMSFWVGVFLYGVSIVGLLWFLLTLRWILNAGGFGQWWQTRRSSKSVSKTTAGLSLFLQGEWQRAERLLASSASDSPIAKINGLFAAVAAARDDHWQRAQQRLNQVKADHPEAAVEVQLLSAELLIEQSNYSEALQLLQPLERENPQNPGVLKLLYTVHRSQSNWAAVAELLPRLKKVGVFSQPDLQQLAVEIYAGQLQAFSTSPAGGDREDALNSLWSTIPKSMRQQPLILIPYLDALVSVGNAEKAQNLLLKALSNQWHQQLIEKLGTLEGTDLQKRLAAAEKWQLQYPNDPDLLFALGRICRQMGLVGKARDYLTATLAITPTVRGHYELAALLAALNDTEGSANSYRKGLELAIVEDSASS